MTKVYIAFEIALLVGAQNRLTYQRGHFHTFCRVKYSNDIGIFIGDGLLSNAATIFIQVGIPIAAGMMLPVTGTLLTPSIAGALMGLSSIGVTLNSLLLRFRFSENQKHMYGSTAKTTDYVNFDLPEDREQKVKHRTSDARWKGA